MSAADFLFTPTLQRVLGAALGRPAQSFTLQELLRKADAGRGSAQKQIDRLVDAGILVDEPRRGRQRSIRANTQHFLYPELRSIAIKTFGLLDPVREALAPHAATIEQAFLFGSVVKGTDGADSDIDVVIIGTTPPIDLIDVESRLQDLLGRPVHFNFYSPPEWLDLSRTDPVISQIAEGPRLDVFPHDKTR